MRERGRDERDESKDKDEKKKKRRKEEKKMFWARGKNNRVGIWVRGAVQSQRANVSRIDRKASEMVSSEREKKSSARSIEHRSSSMGLGRKRRKKIKQN